MIFATCGSSHFQFTRMMDALKALPADQLCVQHGPAQPPPCALAHRYLPFEEIVEQIEAADFVVTHAGVGSILCATRAGHTPVIFPRLRRYGEVVDGHQDELADALAARGTALVARTGAELAAAIAVVPPRRSVIEAGSLSLVHAVRAQIIGEQLAPVPQLVSASQG